MKCSGYVNEPPWNVALLQCGCGSAARRRDGQLIRPIGSLRLHASATNDITRVCITGLWATPSSLARQLWHRNASTDPATAERIWVFLYK